MANRYLPEDENEDSNPTGIKGRHVRQKLLEQRKKKPVKKLVRLPTGEKEMQELMRLAEYEVAHDPYRGIGFLNNGNNREIKNIEMKVGVDVDNHKTRPAFAYEEGKRIDKIVTPWDICQWGIFSMEKREKEKSCTSMDGNKTDDSIVLDPDDIFDLVRNTTESSCPSILSWTRKNLEERNRKQQSHENKIKRNAIGKKRKRAASEETRNDTLPCAKSPHLGMRPSNMKYRCSCDSNPFCLGSMGGVMNDLLKERSATGTVVSIINEGESTYGKSNSKDMVLSNIFKFDGDSNHHDWRSRNGHVAEIETVDVDQNKNITSARIELKEHENLLKFLEGSKTLSDFRKTTQPSKSTIVTYKRLSLGRSKLQIGKLGELYFSVGDTNEHKSCEEIYSRTTKDEIDKLRQFEKLDISNAKQYVENIYKSFDDSKINGIGMTLNDYIRTMIKWHESLLFVDPMSRSRNLSSNLIRIALPPGIQNLGATCYLNTQLQCIAQNPVFLDGIFSWRPLNATHKMNGVMKKLQKLLAQMLVGGDCKYTSLDFSNALGIQHNEQQDPNEFARLLFDRMEESFQQCSINNGDSLSGEHSLGKLLHRIFHGTITYETVCMKCRKKSVRSEGFMDLNLPIVQRQKLEENTVEELNENDGAKENAKDPSFSKRKRKIKGNIKNAFQKQKHNKNNLAETNVQYCFDQYTKPEVLRGDNRYFCEACNCKQEAMRIMSLTKLPPVLNIQLSRYVFDRKKFVKKKLMDKVRLPTILTVNQHEIGTDGKADISKIEMPPEKKYLLCAVMKHQGTSACSGHYVAEAMDWTIGQWYEFNDERVKLIPAPSNSYIPLKFLHTEDKKIQDSTDSDGSQDAYNMYYVHEEYLGKIAISTMLRNKHLCFVHNGSNERQSKDIDVLSDLIREKVQKYSVLTELCKIDHAVSDRLMRRKKGIRKFMFANPSSLLPQEGQIRDSNEPYFWVDGKALRQFVACDSSLDSILKSDDPMICPMYLLCMHGRLHPRNARRGKILPKSIYDSYVSLLSEERKVMCATSSVKETNVIGCVISSEEGMTCDQCAKCYRNDLSKKLEFLRTIIDLYVDIIDEAKDSTKRKTRDSITHGISKEKYSYVVTRATIAKFKKLVIDLFKAVADFWEGSYLNDSTADFESTNKTVLDGIDDLDLSSFPGSPTYRGRMRGKEMKKMELYDSLDEKFNSKITCSHGNCNEFSLRVVRYVPHKTWAKIKKVFPRAIDHKILLHTVDGKMRKPNIKDDGCTYCCRERDATRSLTSDIEKWAKKTGANPSLKEMLHGNKVTNGGTLLHHFDHAQNDFRLVHGDDIRNFSNSVRLLRRLTRTKLTEILKVKTHVENIAFPRYHTVTPNFEKQPDARLVQSMRALTCCEHKRVIKSAIIDSFENGDEIQQRCRLSNSISVLSGEEYSSYINALTELLIILNCDYQNNEILEETLQENSLSMFENVKTFGVLCHPQITIQPGGGTPTDQRLLFSLDGNPKEVSIVPGICDQEICRKDFVSIIPEDAEMTSESVSAGTCGMNRNERYEDAGRNTKCRIRSTARSPIVVESDLEDSTDVTENMQNIRIFQYEADSKLQDALQSLRTAVGLSSNKNDAPNFGLRRSTRKRNAKFPIGCITCEYKINIGLLHNVAALRLLLYQNCQIPLECELSMVMLLDEKSRHQCIEVTFDLSKSTLGELFDELKNMGAEFNLLKSKSNEHFYLLCHVDNNEKSRDVDTALMDTMLQISNIHDRDKKSFAGVEKRRRDSERGFEGTLLQSSILTSHAANQVSKDSNDSITAGKRSVSNTIILDDELDEMSTKATTVVDDFVSNINDIQSPSKRGKQSSKIDVQKLKIVTVLKEITESKDESGCYEAVSWAMKSNPKYNEEEIIDAALNRLFENSSSLTT